MTKTDFKKELRELYNPSAKTVTLVDVPKMNFIKINGQGAPEGKDFQESIEVIYAIARTIKFNQKKTDGIDYGVMPLEGLWWAEDLSVFDAEKGDRNKWQWTLMIMQPDFITESNFENAKAVEKKKRANPTIERVLFESFKEGDSAQIMHIGSFLEEGPNVQRIYNEIVKTGGKLFGKYHEIYLSDFRRVNPANMKTIIRQPYLPWHLIRHPYENFPL